MLTCDQLQSQVSATSLQTEVINPSRSITEEDEAYLRDYTLAASVISWDEGTFDTSLQVTAADITNIAIAADTVWYQINYHRAIPLDIETFCAHRLQIQHYAHLEVAKECQQQQKPDGHALDSVSCQMQPTTEACSEFDQGRHHGQQDAQARLHPIHTKPSDGYSTGYLEGYNRVLNPTTQQPEASLQLEWSITRNEKWHWYDVWVGCKWVGRAETDEEAEREAQAYVATDEIRKRQNAVVMRAYA